MSTNESGAKSLTNENGAKFFPTCNKTHFSWFQPIEWWKSFSDDCTFSKGQLGYINRLFHSHDPLT